MLRPRAAVEGWGVGGLKAALGVFKVYLPTEVHIRPQSISVVVGCREEVCVGVWCVCV